MQQKTIEDYKKEMLEMSGRSVFAAAPLPQYDVNDSTSGQGKLVVILTAARGAYPLKNGEVKVYENKGNNLVTTLRTDENGQTYAVSLPAPRRNLSEAPGELSRDTYALYDIVASVAGFETMRINAVPVFDGVTSLQTVNMLSVSAANGGSGTIENTQNDYQL